MPDLGALATGDVQPYAVTALTEFSATASTDMLTDEVQVDEAGSYQVMVSLSASTTFSMKLTNGTKSQTSTFEQGDDLVANAWYSWPVTVQPGDTYNFQVGADCTVWMRVNKQMLA